MGLILVTDGTTGATDGTPVSQNGTRTNPLRLPKNGDTLTAHVRCEAGTPECDDLLLSNLPTEVEVSFDTVTWYTSSHVFGNTQASVGTKNVPVYLRQPSQAASNIGSCTTAGSFTAGTAPTLSGTLTATGGSGKVTLSGPTASDNVGIDHYVIEYGTTTSYGSTQTVSSIATTFPSTDVTGLTAGTTYYFRLKAYDAAGNASAGLTASAATIGSDTTAPSLSGTLTATAGNGQVVLDWPDATDAVGVTGYDVEYGTTTGYGSTITDPTTSTATVTGLSNGTLYYFRVRAYDAAGNTSGWLTATATPALSVTRTTTGVLLADNFNRASLGSGWTLSNAAVAGSAAAINASTVLRLTGGTSLLNGFNLYASGAGTSVADAFVQFKLPTMTNVANFGAILRSDTTNAGADSKDTHQNYLFATKSNGSDVFYRNTGGTEFTSLGSATYTPTAGDRILFGAKGTALTVYRTNGGTTTLIHNYTHSGYTSGTPGLFYGPSASGNKVTDTDNWVFMKDKDIVVSNLPSGWYVMAHDGTNYVKSAVGTGSGNTTIAGQTLDFTASNAAGVSLYFHNADPGTTYNNAATVQSSLTQTGVYGGDVWTF